MSKEVPPLLFLYYPLFGATFDSEGVGKIADGVVVYVPERDEWRTIQKTSVWRAQWGSQGGKVEGPTPPCCIVTAAPLDGATSIEMADDLRTALKALAKTAVTALRLHQAGWFMQPEQAMYVFSAPRLPINILRSPGPYRQVFVAGDDQVPLPGYDLRIEDCAQPGPLAAVWDLVARYGEAGANSSVEIALASFHRSYGFNFSPSSRAANLFTAMDAMLGGMSAWKIGKVPIKPRGYARRVETGLRCAGADAPPGAAHEAARWLNAERGGRGLRNAIAHSSGAKVNHEAKAAYDGLQAIVRTLLRQYMSFATHWSTNRDATNVRLGLDADAPVAGAYATALEAESRDQGSMVDLLSASATQT